MGRPVTRSIGRRHRIDKPETQAALKQDREWTNLTQAVLREDT
jgi:hypothetical protein